MNKHTPGPWEYHADWSQYGSEHTEFSLDAGDTNIISGCGCCGSPTISSEADARLIAAAPEMLEALKRLASAVCHLGLTEYHGSLAVTVNAARAAIAKAEGGSDE